MSANRGVGGSEPPPPKLQCCERQREMSSAASSEKRGGGRRRGGGASSGSISTVIRDILKRRLGQDQLQVMGIGSEKEALLVFCQTFQAERQFSQLPHSQRLNKLLHLLGTQRVCDEWMGGCEDGEHVRCVLMTLRLLLRDETYQRKSIEGVNLIPALAKSLEQHARSYLTGSLEGRDTLKELTNIFQKLSSSSCHGDALVGVAPDVPAWMVRLLSARDLTVAQCALCTLINISKSPSGAAMVSSLFPFPSLLYILQYYDPSSRHLSSDLLLLLVRHDGNSCQRLKEMDGLPICLRLLHSDDLHILHRIVSVLERLLEDRELQDDVRLLGGIPLILSLLSKTDDSGHAMDKIIALKTASCSVITQMLLNDTNSQHIAQENGVYLLAKLVLPVDDKDEKSGDKGLREDLQKQVWRALRYVYSSERNRKLFRRIFPPKLFEVFIDIGNYIRDLSAYTALVGVVTRLPASELASLRSSVEESNQLRSPQFSVGGYSVLELLGSGAFGNVYKVRKKNADTFLAMKEIKSSVPLLGRTLQERSSSIGKLMNEVNIMREQLHHPNIVHYHKCFEEGGHLYIVMELIEGAPLRDHITSLAEKKEHFEEERIWRIFTQLTLALRYIHKEKCVTHRDLTPSNVMLGDGDKLTITDFGLAKQKQREFSVMESTVGTMAYWCPELVQNEPYTEKADIWAAGCILYQMATLRVPFQTNNILALAKRIAEVDYPPIPDGLYSSMLSEVVTKCLTADPSDRPDSVALGALLAGPLMREADRLALSRDGLQRRLDRERQRTQRHLNRTVWTTQQSQELPTLTPPTSLTLPTSSSTPTSSRKDSSARRRISDSFASHPPPLTGPISHPPILTSPTSTAHSTSQDHLIMESGLTYSPVLFHKWSGLEPGGQTDNLQNDLASDWDQDSDTSESVFPETLPQLTNQMQPVDVEKGAHIHGNGMTSSPGIGRENPLSSRPARGRSYSAVIPGQTRAWQSGRGYPHTQSAHSSGRGLPPVGVASTGSPLRHRTSSSSSLLSISSRHFREISDPITQLLGQLQRLIYLSQAPPTSSPSARQMVLDQYQRALFHSDTSPAQLKGELHRLETHSGEGVWLLEEGVWSVGPRLVRKAMEELAAHSHGQLLPPIPEPLSEAPPLTYDLLANMVDSLLEERGYLSPQ